ncbi:N-acetylmuramoyl-L-alanine amidase [Flavobacterium pedocola]
MKKLFTILFALFAAFTLKAQIVVIDPGHGYGATTSDNPDGRTATEIETSLEVGLRTRTLIQNSCSAWTVQMTRTTNLNSWISVTQRAQMANNWNADRLLSIHCNAGGGTGTETFYCTDSDTNTAPDIAFAQKIQNDMATNGAWNNRRCVEDNSFLAYHLGVLKYSSATGCLNEIGFVDSADATKLTSSAWRDTFALSYFNSLKSNLGVTCSAPLPGAFTLTATPECSGTTSQIRLNWTASSNANSYDIYRNGNLYASDITGTQFLNTYITVGTNYTYYIKAKNTTGSTNNSNGTLSATAITCAPGSFTLTATATCSGTTSAINLTWTASANATSYDIYRNGNLYAADVTGTSFLNTYLITAGSTYTYYLKAKNSVGSITNSNGTRSVTAISCAKISDETATSNEPEFTFYPNPASDFITLEFEKPTVENIEVTIMDVNGKTIFTDNIPSDKQTKTIDISGFSSGIYFLKAASNGKQHFRKIIKK